MKDPLTEGLKETGEVLKKVYTDFMKIYEKEDLSEDKPEKVEDSKEESQYRIPPMHMVVDSRSVTQPVKSGLDQGEK